VNIIIAMDSFFPLLSVFITSIKICYSLANLIKTRVINLELHNKHIIVDGIPSSHH
jgi:hypothetical protein